MVTPQSDEDVSEAAYVDMSTAVGGTFTIVVSLADMPNCFSDPCTACTSGSAAATSICAIPIFLAPSLAQMAPCPAVCTKPVAESGYTMGVVNSAFEDDEPTRYGMCASAKIGATWSPDLTSVYTNVAFASTICLAQSTSLFVLLAPSHTTTFNFCPLTPPAALIDFAAAFAPSGTDGKVDPCPVSDAITPTVIGGSAAPLEAVPTAKTETASAALTQTSLRTKPMCRGPPLWSITNRRRFVWLRRRPRRRPTDRSVGRRIQARVVSSRQPLALPVRPVGLI